jgi:hypothetical protein
MSELVALPSRILSRHQDSDTPVTAQGASLLSITRSHMYAPLRYLRQTSMARIVLPHSHQFRNLTLDMSMTGLITYRNIPIELIVCCGVVLENRAYPH